MVRYAEWREAVDPERPFERYDPLLRLGASMVAGIAGGACCGCLSVPLFLWTWKTVGKESQLRRVSRLRDIPSVHLQITARLTLESGSTTYGRDEGIVSLVDGTILFEGRRTSFSVRRSEVDLEHLSRKGFSFWFPSPGGDCRAIINASEEDEMATAISLWAIHDEEPEDTSLFPPFRPDPSTRKQVDGLRILLGCVGTGSAFVYLLWAAAIEPNAGFIAALLTLFAWGSGWHIVDRKRRCLAHLEQAALPSRED